jgi:Iap family predicted aminopeptidase
MQEIGLVSGTNDPGSAWRSAVPLVSTRQLESRITMRTNKGSVTLGEDEAMALTGSRRALIDGTEVILVGEDTSAVPSEEITGRIVLVRGDLTARSEERREDIFEARPAAVITMVDDQAIITRLRESRDTERLSLQSEESNRLEAYVTDAAMEAALPEGEWQALSRAVSQRRPGFAELEATIAIDARASRREFVSSNVISLLPGTVRGAGAVLVLAHWDHLGECAPGTPDPICNGAIDNASGLAAMLELAARLKANGPHERDIYFLATSAEESGLLGAKAFIATPPVPLDTIVAAFNFDTSAVAPSGSSVGFVGEGRTTLDAIIRETLREGGRDLGNRDFAESFVRRQDGWVFLEEGVPTVLLSTAFSSEIVLGPYLAETYHRPGDSGERMELGGAIDDVLLHEELIRKVANTALFPAQ